MQNLQKSIRTNAELENSDKRQLTIRTNAASPLIYWNINQLI